MRIKALSYAVVDAVAPEAWARFGEDVLGMMAIAGDGGVALKMDARAGRIFIRPGAVDRYAASGWEIADQAQFRAALDKLNAAGVAFTRGTAAECAFRHVQDLVRFQDPSGNQHELALGFVTDFAGFQSPQGVPRFITDELGFGHVVLPAPDFDRTAAFLADVMGFGLADILVHRPMGPAGPAQRIHFLHCDNGRHHSLALFEGEVPAGCVHLMVEVESMDEVGRAYDRMLRAGVPLMATLGKHTNDHMTSFYMATPGGFALEYGYGGRTVDWDRHTLFESTSVSLWGHDFSVGFAAADPATLANAA
ncbi:3,4-dihydroxy-9,10-secoandrosta-1,3,5(10)-triene-9,17-dione 4,5-dioxygenase [Sphingomonas laterariae]|uniref:3,4-dihydroxy-9,10-secoandrosta-1,3,5(10)-triene-9,17-dione 4,5-dioxygenase n=1 Tax=Edaphosphingomonas laterariae TaxID=861865 RepID=A0A239J6L3_9SPHN|nr:VOC family protein [Sphingomonas laterariae]SNT00893.1 3,4-dihydroxy-9,10-secoandrosta-1,3,5(10)-triene-9,17-dione 4,5-dioxygenase [Sphingomonas laterariae]